jgi:hypothetical protein
LPAPWASATIQESDAFQGAAMTANEDELDTSFEAGVQLDNLQFDCTETSDIDAQGILWLVQNDLPPNVSGVDYSRAVSHAPSEPSA